MQFFRSSRQLLARLALWALVLNALLPLSAQAMMRAVADADLLEVCTSTGMVRVQVQAGDATATDQPASGASPAQSCQLCLLHHGMLALPGGESPRVDMPALADHPPRFHSSSHTSSVWLSARSRAPPELA